MKRLFAFLPVAIIALFTSCDNTVLTARLAEGAVKKDVFWDTPYMTSTFKTGYYETNSHEIERLTQLYTAGVIELSIDRAVEEERYWGSVYYTDHYFADVKLTSKGKKYVFEGEIKSGRKDLLDELKDNDEEEKIPDYMVELKDVKINTLLPDPSAKEQKSEKSNNSYNHYADDNNYSSSNSSYSYNSSSNDTKTPTAYEQACAKANSEYVTVILCEFGIVKTKEIYCPEEYYKMGKGECKVISEVAEKTPFGHVYGAPAEGSRKIESVSLKRYEDLGWVVEE